MGLYDYMTPEELEYAKESAIIENEALKFDHEFQILAFEHAMRINDIDTKALLDNYTEAVLEDAYMEELRIYEEGVKETWEKFKAWLLDLINKILGKKTPDISPEDAKKKVTLPFNLTDLKEKLSKIPSAIKSVFSNDEGDPDGKKIAAIVLGTAAGFGILEWIKKVKEGNEKTEVDAGTVKENIPFVTKLLNDIKSQLGNLKEKPGVTSVLSGITEFGGWIKNKANDALSKIGEGIQDTGKKISKKAEIAKTELKHGKTMKDSSPEDGELDPAALGNESTNDLLDSMDEISFYESSDSMDLIMETVSKEDMDEINSLLESL